MSFSYLTRDKLVAEATLMAKELEQEKQNQQKKEKLKKRILSLKKHLVELSDKYDENEISSLMDRLNHLDTILKKL